MFCSNCRNEIDKAQLFCRACGEKTKIEKHKWLLRANLFLGVGIITFIAFFMFISRSDDFFRAIPPFFYYSFFALLVSVMVGTVAVLSYELRLSKKQTKRERKHLRESSNYTHRLEQNISPDFVNSVIDQTTKELIVSSKITSGNLR
jgi:hypothetical protein